MYIDYIIVKVSKWSSKLGITLHLYGHTMQRCTFNLRQASQSHICKGYAPLSVLRHQCFQIHFQGIPLKMHFVDTIINYIVLYGYKDWGPSLRLFDWEHLERVQTIMLQCTIHCKWIVPQNIAQSHPHIDIVFSPISYLHSL